MNCGDGDGDNDDGGMSEADIAAIDEQMSPVDDGPTTDNTAGIGVELETVSFKLRTPTMDCSQADTHACKRLVITAQGTNDKQPQPRKGTNWELQVDTGYNANELNPEYVLDGKILKVGVAVQGGTDTLAVAAAKAVYADIFALNPTNNKVVTLPNQKGGEKCPNWIMQGLTTASKATDAKDLVWEPQVTVPMPLEALWTIMQAQWNDFVALKQQQPLDPNLNILAGAAGQQTSWAGILVTQEFFQSKPNGIDPAHVTDDVLAFCSLVLSYAKAIKQQQPFASPKMVTTFMTRTNFNTVFEQVKSKIPGDLFELFNVLACYYIDIPRARVPTATKLRLDKKLCTGTKAKPVPRNTFGSLEYEYTGPPWEPDEPDDGQQPQEPPPTKINVRDWITGIDSNNPSPDLLTQFDRNYDSSIGGLGTALEKVVGGQRQVPLFEFRSLSTINTEQVEKNGYVTKGFVEFVQQAEQAVINLHNRFPNAPQRRNIKKRESNCTASFISNVTITPTLRTSASNPGSVSSAQPTAKMSCSYMDRTPENPTANCQCVSGSSTITALPMTLPSVSVITQSCDYSTWPGQPASITAPPQAVMTNLAACEVCTSIGPNEDNCVPLASALSCTPATPTTVLSGGTSGVTVGTLTGTAFYSAITSAMDQLCAPPVNTGAATGNFTCNQEATATVASNIKYKSGQNWDMSGVLTLQFREASYDSLESYSQNKAALAAFAQNSTQNNCQNITADPAGFIVRDGVGSQGGDGPDNPHNPTQELICQAGANYQIIVFDSLATDGKSKELSFDLSFKQDPNSKFLCQFIESVLEFVEVVVSNEVGADAALPREFLLDQKMEKACESSLGKPATDG